MADRVVILLPCHCGRVMGGLRIALDYANSLAERGCAVTIAQPMAVHWERMNLRRKMRAIARGIFYLLFPKRRSPTWMAVHPSLRFLWIPTLAERHVPEADIYVATAVQTAQYLNDYKRRSRKIYLIQGFENWDVSDAEVLASYRFGMRNVAVSNWLARLVEKTSDTPCKVIPNGIDLQEMRCVRPPEDRPPATVSLMYHTGPGKGLDVSFAALEKVKRQVPDLKVRMFGAYRLKRPVPDWYDYVLNPSRVVLRQIYNETSVYVGASRSEGYGLTIGEAMACGCAVCCTDCAGYVEMAKDGETALVSPVDDVDALAAHICRLIRDRELRLRLAASAQKFIAGFGIETSRARFCELCLKQH